MATVDGKAIVGLSKIKHGSDMQHVEFLLERGEQIALAYTGLRDSVILTSKKLIAIDVKGMTGKKIEYLCIPYSKVTAYAVETAGKLDLDCELKIWAPSIGMLHLGFVKGTDVKEIATFFIQKVS